MPRKGVSEETGERVCWRVGLPDFPRESASLAEPAVLSGHLDSAREAAGDLVEEERRGGDDDICTPPEQDPNQALEVLVTRADRETGRPPL